MTGHATRRRGLAGGALIVASSLMGSHAAAQAWLPTRGALDVTAVYTDLLSEKHYLPDGSEIDVGHTRTAIAALLVNYGLTDRLTISVGIPYVTASYHGDFPHPTEPDDGHEHATLTDWRVGLHFQATEGPVAFAPYLQYSRDRKSVV